MPVIKPLHLLSSLALAASLSACGGGGGDDADAPDDGSVPLSSESDVLREVAVLTSAVTRISDITGAFDDSADVAASAASPKLMAKSSRSIAKADSENCPDGGTDGQTNGAEKHTFAYFGNISPNTAYQSYVFAACKRTVSTEDGQSASVTLNGAAKAGATLVASDGADYRYLQAGASNAPLQLVVAATAGPAVTLSLLGGQEAKTTEAEVVSGNVLAATFSTAGAGNTNVSGNFSLGTAAAPFYFTTSKTTSAYGLDGPYDYHTTKCDGGAATAATPADLVTAPDGEDGSIIVGGTLKLSTPHASVSVVFAGDGSATYQFAGGSSGTLTRAEIEAAIANQNCGI